MDINALKSEEKLTIRFNGKDEIDLITLQESLNYTVDALKAIADKTINEDEFCKFKVTKVEKGSFVLTIISVIESTIIPILPEIPTVLTTFKTCLDIKKHLKGEEPKSVERKENVVNVENNHGEINVFNNTVFNIYASESKIEKNISKMFNAVALDSDREGIVVEIETNKKKEEISFDKNDLIALKKPLDMKKFEKNIAEDNNISVIRVRRVDLSGDGKWICYLSNTKISVDIIDEEFLNKVHNGEIAFSSNTKLKVEMLIRYELCDDGMPDVSSKPQYTVIKVIEIIGDSADTSTLF